MHLNAKQDLVGGLVVVVVGVAASAHAIASYDIGTPGRMGPGFFPLCLGICMVLLGSLIAAFSTRSTAGISIEGRPMAAVLVSIALFALVLPVLGLLPATIIQVLVSLMPDRRLKLTSLAVISLVVAAVALLVFRIGLNIALPVARWPL